MSDALDPEPLLRALHDAGIRYVIIGGFAVNAHGVIRPSKDLDIVPDPDPANLTSLAEGELNGSHVRVWSRSPDRDEARSGASRDLAEAARRRRRARESTNAPRA